MKDLGVVLRMALADVGNGRIKGFIRDITADDTTEYQRYDAFCEEFELGQWFYDALANNNVEIVAMLSDLLAERRK